MWVTIESGAGKGTSVRVEGERFLVGTAPECQLIVGDTNVEPLHAYFEVRGDGHVVLHDLGTEGGTFVDDQRIDGARELEGGEQVRIGDTVLLPTIEEPAGEEPPSEVGESAPGVRVRTPEGQTLEVVRVGEHRRLRERIGLATGVAVAAAVVAIAALAVFLATRGGGHSTADIVKYAGPRTVLVRAALDRRQVSSGSGFVLDASRGLIATNFHVVNGARDLAIGVGGGLRLVTLYAAAPCDDLALVKVDDSTGLRTFPLGSQSDVREGDRVVAVGYPANASLDTALTSTAGVVSVVRTAFRAPTPEAPPYRDAIQTDAALNPGNSGGPLVDDHERVVGVNSGALTRIGRTPIQNQGYAIGIDRAKVVLRELASGRSQGYGGFGIALPPRGARAGLVAIPTTPAATALNGGLVTAINGAQLKPSFASYCDAVRSIRSGQTAVLTVLRRGRVSQVPIKFR